MGSRHVNQPGPTSKRWTKAAKKDTIKHVRKTYKIELGPVKQPGITRKRDPQGRAARVPRTEPKTRHDRKTQAMPARHSRDHRGQASMEPESLLTPHAR